MGKYFGNPAALCYEWSEDRATYQLVALRGINAAVSLGVRPDTGPNAGKWSSVQCDRGRWSCDGTLKDFKRLVSEWFDASNGGRNVKD